jgi:hypothetical protein
VSQQILNRGRRYNGLFSFSNQKPGKGDDSFSGLESLAAQRRQWELVFTALLVVKSTRTV